MKGAKRIEENEQAPLSLQWQNSGGLCVSYTRRILAKAENGTQQKKGSRNDAL